MPKGVHPNSLANLRPFRSGQSGHPGGGSQTGGATIRQWMNAMLLERDGRPAYTLAQLQRIVDAPANSRSVSPAKRIAARRIIEAIKRGSDARAEAGFLIDNTDGRPTERHQITTEGEVHIKHVILGPDPHVLPTNDGAQIVDVQAPRVLPKPDAADDSPGEAVD